MAWLGPDTALFVGQRGSAAFVWRTVDHGRTWSASAIGSGFVGNAAVLGREVWLTRPCAVESADPCEPGLLHSVDGGATWTSISTTPVEWLSFTSAEDGWGVAPGPSNGDPKPLVRTADAGRTWTPAGDPCGVTGQPVAVSFATVSHGWLACDEDLGAGSAVKGIFETTDGGARWTLRAAEVLDVDGQGFTSVGSLGSGGYLRGLRMTAGGRGLAWFGRGGVTRTSDGGATWTTTSDAEPDVIEPFAAWVLDETHWFLLVTDADHGGATSMEETLDGGGTWTRVLTFP